jgi:enamine deaminase RidA (YjgF/YER057c/UK114 family)
MGSGDLAKVPYDYATVVSAGSILFTAGACPLDALGQVIGLGDYGLQAERTIENLLEVLAHHGAGAEHLVRTTIYVVGDRQNLSEVWDTVAAGLAPQRPPSTLLGVSCLGYPNQLVEVDGIAAIPA